MELAFTLDLRDDPRVISEYVRAHRRVWQEVTEATRAVGIMEERIWLHGTRLFLLLVAEDGFDFERDMARYLELPRTREWDDLMRALQSPAPGGDPDGWWVRMQKVFDLSWSEAESDHGPGKLLDHPS